MRKVWVVAANSGESRIYRIENSQQLVEYGRFFHEESHLSARDLVSDKQGRETNKKINWGTDTYEPKTSIKTKEREFFAEEIARFLTEKYQAGECERIYIIAKAPFLGVLRSALEPNIAKIVEAEVHKDLVHLNPEDIREYLPPAL